MAYPQKLLAAGEVVQFELRPHFRALFVPIIILLGIVFVGSWLFFVTDNTILRWAIAIIALVLFVPFVLIAFLRWLTTQYVFTNRRIITRQGIVAKRGRDMPLSKVQNVSFDISVMGRLLNYGALRIDSANAEGDLVIVDVPHVEEIQREVYRLHEEDDSRRRHDSGDGSSGPMPSDGT
jgi:uncharacterized membrane protein YdbT with pleckstrin-like domain